MRFFLAGIMQGSLCEPTLHNQTYRRQVAGLLARAFPEAEVYDPLALHADSIDYDDATGRQVFMQHNCLCREVDVVVAFLPEASMGTAIEIWEAHRHGRLVIAISPMIHNWAVKFLSDVIFPDVETFADALADGRVRHLVERQMATRTNANTNA
ncbi:MAG TPA: hypothetical protein VMF30_19795 [Pirellulales bacterium]|nr:hypothetical protein [Pirellulales bacterium]